MKKPEKKKGEIIETIMIFIALLSLLPVVLWWHTGSLSSQRYYYFYLFLLLCILGYITYRRIKRLRVAIRASKRRGSGPPLPPFFS
ncbi:MAG: hypothetical protein ACUVWN_06955 [bacterium]